MDTTLQMSVDERALMSCVEPCPLALRILGSAFMHKAVTLEDVQSLSSSSNDGAIGVVRCGA